jgi:hypothetical protein
MGTKRDEILDMYVDGKLDKSERDRRLERLAIREGWPTCHRCGARTMHTRRGLAECRACIAKFGFGDDIGGYHDSPEAVVIARVLASVAVYKADGGQGKLEVPPVWPWPRGGR